MTPLASADYWGRVPTRNDRCFCDRDPGGQFPEAYFQQSISICLLLGEELRVPHGRCSLRLQKRFSDRPCCHTLSVRVSKTM